MNRGSAVADVAEVSEAFAAHGYLADEGLATAVFLAMRLQRPLLLEGDAGVGKTEVAKAIASWTGGELIRLQCYEGLDANQAVYEWDHARQLLHLRAAEASGAAVERGTSARNVPEAPSSSGIVIAYSDSTSRRKASNSSSARSISSMRSTGGPAPLDGAMACRSARRTRKRSV